MPMSGWRVGGNNVDAVSWAIDLSGGSATLSGMGLADIRSDLPLITGSRLRLLAAESLRNLSLLRLAKVELFLHVAGRALRAGAADAAENRNDERTRAKGRSHDLLLCSNVASAEASN
jgi:hypothetical protein